MFNCSLTHDRICSKEGNRVRISKFHVGGAATGERRWDFVQGAIAKIVSIFVELMELIVENYES